VSVADPTHEQLELLLELQATDHRIRRLEHQLDDLPEQRQLVQTEARIGELGREHDDVKVDLDRAAAEQRQLERETEVLTERRDAERTRLYDGTVHSARELKAVEAEIDTTERRISEHEDLLLDVLEKVEELQARVDALLADREAQQERADELNVARDESAKGILAELGELQALRIQQAAGLPADLLARYETAAKRAGGTGVGKLESNSCTACRLSLSMADVGELYAGPPLTTCPQCRRLLVVPA
jgi:predicted  nucleic acid-binding Zn-ribbon protein